MRTDRSRKWAARLVIGGLALLIMVLAHPNAAGVDANETPFAPTIRAGIVEAPVVRMVSLGEVAGEIVVGAGREVTTITQALERAEDGDRIRVLPGTYTDAPITIDKSVEIIGEDFPVLDGESREGILLITAPDVTVQGFVLRNTGVSHVRDHAAIKLDNARNGLIEGNRLEDTFFGIYLAQAHGSVVRGNEMRASGTTESSSGNGVHVWNVEDATVENNYITGHRDGVYLEFAKRATIRHNLSEGNLRYGLHFMFSDDSVYEGNTFKQNAAGVAVMFSRNVAMTGNRFEENWGTSAYGLLLKDVADSRIERNLFRQNTTALLADGTDRLVFRNNRVERNGWAVKIQASSQDSHFTANDFEDNTFDVVTNSRRSYNTFDGNYWSRYQGYDLTGDGIGDVPYRPVRLFSFIVETKPMSIILLRSFFVDLLDVAERVLPVLTPETLVDDNPRMRPIAS